VSSIVSDFVHAQSAFNKPTLTLLGKGWAPVIIAVFTSHFSRDRARIPADQFHVQVETSLDELRIRGETVPEGASRDLCRRWVQQQWLSLASNDENVEEYALTSHAQEAIEYVTRLSGDRAMFGESRILTILDAARRCATEANPNREDRLRRLDEEIADLAAERERIAAGGEIQPASDDRMLDEYLNLHGLLSALPSDFMRVSEAVKEIHRGIIADFRADERRSGEVLDDYLRRADRLMDDSPEGRAFTGAVQLLRNDRWMADLRDDLHAILTHGFAAALTPEERTSLRRTVAMIGNGIHVVLEQRRRLSNTLRTHMGRHDPLRDKELDLALRDVQTELATWMETAGPRAKIPVDLGLAHVDVGHLRQRLYNPADHNPPPPLAQITTDPESGASFEDLLKQGGPNLASLRQAIDDRLRGGDAVTTAEVWAGLPDDLRRPVEVLGLIHLAATASDGGQPDSPTALFDTVRPNGERRTFRAPALRLSPHPFTSDAVMPIPTNAEETP
jgi:hypothetical protein